jgi:hypothetical protein
VLVGFGFSGELFMTTLCANGSLSPRQKLLKVALKLELGAGNRGRCFRSLPPMRLLALDGKAQVGYRSEAA